MFGRFTTLAIVALAATATATSPFSTKPAQTTNTRKAKMISKLMEGARPTENSKIGRSLEQVDADISGYEIKFEKCQFVKAYDDELAEDEEASTVLATKHFVIFRLCPSGSCSSCSYNFGEYVIDMESYLEAATQFFVEDRENQCEFCNQICEADDDGLKSMGLVDCDTCYSYCANIEAMEDNGYVESYEFTECMQVYESDDDGNSQIFSGAVCSNNGQSISIGAFSDEDCLYRKSGVDIEDYLENGMTFDTEILEKVTDSSSCVSCIRTEYEVPDNNENENNNNNNDEEEEIEVNEMCEQLYEGAAKCESKFGFNNYWKDYEEYYNQYIQEDLVCDFISSINNGNYDQYGEIVLNGSKTSGSPGASGGQKFFLTFFVLSTIGLGVFAASLHSNLTKGGKADLSTQGGAMA